MNNRGNSLSHRTHHKLNYSISTDPHKLDIDILHRYLAEESYWAAGIPRALLEKAIENSLCFGVYDGEKQVGFARVVTDRATFAYLCDVFILESHRGRGLSTWLMECIMADPDLQGLRRFVLVTRDVHGLYQRYGFEPLTNPASFMQIHGADPYRSKDSL